jgi:hypothetical protein
MTVFEKTAVTVLLYKRNTLLTRWATTNCSKKTSYQEPYWLDMFVYPPNEASFQAILIYYMQNKTQPIAAPDWYNSVAWVRERTIPTGRPPLVGEVSAIFWAKRVPRGQLDGSLRQHSRLSRPEPLFFLSSSSSIVLTRLSGPRFRPTTPQKIW